MKLDCHPIGQFTGEFQKNSSLYLNINGYAFRHCWNDTWEVCEEWFIRYPESVIGLTPLVTFPGTCELRRVVEKIQLSKIILETDAPYFLPKGGGRHSLMGHTSRDFSVPIHAVNVAAQIAAIKRCDVKKVLQASRANVKRIYGV